MTEEKEDRPAENDREETASFASKVIPDLFRRALMTGIGTVFMTEEGIRSSLSEMKMPKEAMNYVVAQAEKSKRELIATMARELRSFLDGLELQQLMHDAFEDTTFEIHTTIRVKRDGDKKKFAVDEQRTELKRERSDETVAARAEAKRIRKSRKKTATTEGA